MISLLFCLFFLQIFCLGKIFGTSSDDDLLFSPDQAKKNLQIDHTGALNNHSYFQLNDDHFMEGTPMVQQTYWNHDGTLHSRVLYDENGNSCCAMLFDYENGTLIRTRGYGSSLDERSQFLLLDELGTPLADGSNTILFDYQSLDGNHFSPTNENNHSLCHDAMRGKNLTLESSPLKKNIPLMKSNMNFEDAGDEGNNNKIIHITDDADESNETSLVITFWEWMWCTWDCIEMVCKNIGARVEWANNSNECDYWAEKIFGKSFLNSLGYYDNSIECGSYGLGEISDNVRITMINGMLTSREGYREIIEEVSQAHAAVNIHYLFSPTKGWNCDIMKALLCKMGYLTNEVYRLVEVWREMIAEMGGIDGEGSIIHYAHSLGAMQTEAALSLLDPSEKRFLRIFTFGSPSLFIDDDVKKLTHYVSVRDGVCLFDPVSYFRGLLGHCDEIITIGGWLGMPFSDHPICTSSYLPVLKSLGKEFKSEYM